jgi:hypothetical protein
MSGWRFRNHFASSHLRDDDGCVGVLGPVLLARTELFKFENLHGRLMRCVEQSLTGASRERLSAASNLVRPAEMGTILRVYAFTHSERDLPVYAFTRSERDWRQSNE